MCLGIACCKTRPLQFGMLTTASSAPRPVPHPGISEEVRLGRGFMLWKVMLQLTETGLDHVPHIVGSVYRGIGALARATDAQLEGSYAEAAQLSGVRFDWRDRTEPLVLAKGAAHDLHCERGLAERSQGGSTRAAR